MGPRDIHLRTLRDKQQLSADGGDAAETLGVSPSNWAFFGVVWPASRVLAELMLEFPLRGRRVLEVGCGIALPSLVLNQRTADITACDHHPQAGSFLAENTALNHDPDVPFFRAGWSDAFPAPLETFDVIIGSDLLYEPDHSDILARFILACARPVCEVIVVDPHRGHAARFKKNMVVCGFAGEHEITSVQGDSGAAVRCDVLRLSRG